MPWLYFPISSFPLCVSSNRERSRSIVWPVIRSDSADDKNNTALATSIGLGGADIVVAMVLGTSWIEVPEAISVEYSGQLPFGFGGKEVILRTLALLGRNTVAMERSVEYRGDGVRQLSTDSRFAIANMTAEFGGLNGIFEADEVTAAWLAGRTDEDDPQALKPMRAFRAARGRRRFASMRGCRECRTRSLSRAATTMLIE